MLITQKNMKARNLLIGVMILVLLISLIPFIFYIYKFEMFTLASNKEELGQFGDFIGGILNPFLSFANILVLGYLTYEISRIDQNAQERSLDTQRKLVLGQLRHSAFEDYVRVIDNVLHNYDDSGKELSESVGQKAGIAAEKVKTFNENLCHLFPVFKTDDLYTEIIKTFNVISSENSELLQICQNKNFANSEDLKKQQRIKAVNLGCAIEKLREDQRIIKEKLQKFMMDELSK